MWGSIRQNTADEGRMRDPIVITRVATAVASTAKAIHFSCSRSSPWARRSRTSGATAATSRSATPMIHITPNGPCDSVSRGPTPTGLASSGWLSGPCSGEPPSASITTTMNSVRTTAAGSTGRHRGEGRRPSGTRSRASVAAPVGYTSCSTQLYSQSDHCAPGRPGWVMIAKRAY